MSTALVILLSLAVAGGLAWTVRRIELGREPKPTACTDIMDKVFGAGGSATPDSMLLEHLLEHRDACMGDAMYVEQLRHLMVNTQQIDQARALLVEAERKHTFNADELAAQVAWVDFAESHAVWANGDEARASMKALAAWRALPDVASDAKVDRARAHLIWALVNHNDFITLR